jgi:uncharacterized Zn-binding protein involved in type VI secretion
VPAVCRGAGRDPDVPHCSPMDRSGLSPNVRVNGIGISRQTDVNTVHRFPPNIPPCPSHAVGIVAGSSTVRVNALGCGRIGDATCTAVAGGSINVFAGP